MSPIRGGSSFHFRFPIGLRLIAMVVGVALLAGGAVGSVIINLSRDAIRLEVLSKNHAQAHLAGSFASKYVSAVQTHIRTFAQRPDIRQAVLGNTPEQLQPLLADFVKEQTALDSAAVFDASGIQRVNSVLNASTVGQSFNDRAWFQEVMATRQPVQSAPVASRLTGSPSVPYSVPILDDQGQVRGMLNGVIALAQLSDAIVSIDYGQDTRVALMYLKDGGIILGHSDPARVMTAPSGNNEAANLLMAGQSGAIETPSSTGEMDLVGFTVAPGLPWGVLVITPSAAALSLIGVLTQNAALYTSLIILAAGLMGGLVVLGITRPLRRLVRATEEIGRGDLDCRVDTTGHDEVGDLARAMSDMVQELKQTLVSRASLFKEIEERKRAEYDYWTLFNEMQESFALHEIICDDAGAPEDYRFLAVNPAFQEATGLNGKDIVGRTVLQVLPGTERVWIEAYGKVALTGQPINFENYSAELGKHFAVMAFRTEPGKFATLFQDITERKQTEEKTRRASAEWRTTFDSISDMISIQDRDCKVLRANRAYAKALGVPIKEVIGKTCFEIVHGTKEPVPKCPHQKTIKTGKPARLESRDENKGTYSEIFTYPIFDDKGEVTSTVHVIHDVTARKQAEKGLQETVQDLEDAQSLAGLGAWKWVQATNTVSWSDELRHILRYASELPAPTFAEMSSFYTPDSWNRLNEAVKLALQTGQPYEIELEEVRTDGVKINTLTVGRVDLDAAGRVVALHGTVQDFTARKQAEYTISASLAEKELLLKEIHHRVKNNMQVISSLLGLQGQYVTDKSALQMLKESQDRIRSMALVYNKLCDSPDLAQINFRDYTNELVTNLVHAYTLSPGIIKTEIEIVDATFDLDTAVPLGLIINELVTNALKYAFPKGRHGAIGVSLREVDGKYELCVRDDGIGLPEDFDPLGGRSLGMRLINALAEHQLSGKLSVIPGAGTKFQITFMKGPSHA